MDNQKKSKIPGIILGVFFILYGLNQFLHVVPTGYKEMRDIAQEYLDAVLPFLPFLYIFEILVGIVLIWHKWIPFIAIILAPLSVNFLIFNFVNGGWNILPALFVAFLNIILIYQYRNKYKILFD